MNLSVKKPLPVYETESGGGEQTVLADKRITREEYTTGEGRRQAISALLLHGERNAVPLQQLAALTGMDQREVRRAIQAERLRGVPILANNQTGYYLPADDVERAHCVASMRHRAGEIERVADAIERSGSI